VVDEVTGSREQLEARLGTVVKHFAYPSGLFNRGAVDAVAAAGYRYGYTTCTHRDPAFRLLTVPRTLLWENSSCDSHGLFSAPILSCQIHHAFDLVSRCHQRHTIGQGNGDGRL
jgi:hypothetical protein